MTAAEAGKLRLKPIRLGPPVQSTFNRNARPTLHGATKFHEQARFSRGKDMGSRRRQCREVGRSGMLSGRMRDREANHLSAAIATLRIATRLAWRNTCYRTASRPALGGEAFAAGRLAAWPGPSSRQKRIGPNVRIGPEG